MQETFAGIRVIKSFAKENWFIKKFAANNDDYQQTNMLLVKAFGIAFPLVAFLGGITTLILVLTGGEKVMRGEMTIGKFAAFFSYLHMLIWPIMSVGFMINMMQRGAASMARINEILNTTPSITSPLFASGIARAPQGETDAAAETPAISITNLTFKYPIPPEMPKGEIAHDEGGAREQPDALSGVSAEIRQGMFVGILGKTGSGKTTLLKALTRLIDPPAGSVRVFGKDVRDYNLRKLRSLFAVVPQDTYLFSDSIKENIAYAVEHADDESVREAVETAAVAKDLEEFPDGWNTVIGERGVTLSGGQKQRTAIARALMKKDAKIIVLDDALSAVDAETEKRFLARFLRERTEAGGGAENLPRKTTLIVSHRVSTLQRTDMVLVLDGGRIIECGSPRDLMNTGGFFAKTAQLQRLAASSAPNEEHIDG